MHDALRLLLLRCMTADVIYELLLQVNANHVSFFCNVRIS